jgi:hypothetical protein
MGAVKQRPAASDENGAARRTTHDAASSRALTPLLERTSNPRG